MNELQIECAEHGIGDARVVCQHLITGVRLGVFTPDLEPGSPCTEAWCSQCEGVYLRHSEWIKESLDFADFRVVCEHCFLELLRQNRGSWVNQFEVPRG